MGQAWIEGGKDQIGMRHVKLLDALGHRRRGFRSYRRTFRTLAAQTGQELAIDLIMGHADRGDDMAKVYTVEVSREIVRKVCEHVRQSVFSFQPSLFQERKN
jgi:integrase